MSDKAWGIRFNVEPNFARLQKGQIPEGCPDWFGPRQIEQWREAGLIAWNTTDKKVELLSGHATLELLNRLLEKDNWKMEGVSITQLVYRFETQMGHRGRRKKGEIHEPSSDNLTDKSEPVHEEIMHLPPDAGTELIELLQSNKHHITKMVEQEKEHQNRVLKQIFEMLLRSHRTNEESDFDFATRSFRWECKEKGRWACSYQQAQGRVCLDKTLLYWHACVRRAHFVGGSNYFTDLQKAVEWVEKELVSLANQPSSPEMEKRIRTGKQIEADRERLRQKLLGGPNWIDPALIEPARITYQVFIELDAKPINFKTYESMCGETHRYDERYLTPSKMTTALGLDFDRFSVDQPAGENSEWYRIASLTKYYQELSAAEQAQKIWDQSQVLQQFKAGKISRARYGYQEVETGYTVFLGACEGIEKTWEQPCSRKAHLEFMALNESLCFALDVKDFRDYLGVSPETVNDQQILSIMHMGRIRSKNIPEDIRRESKLWIAQHDALAI